MTKIRKYWHARNVKEETALSYRVFAVTNKLTTAQALEVGAKMLPTKPSKELLKKLLG